MTASDRLAGWARGVIADLARTGRWVCECGCPRHDHTPDSTHGDLIHWCAGCDAACTPPKEAA